MNIVLDTNCLIMSLSRRSPYYSVWRNFVEGNYTLCVTQDHHYDVLKQTPFPFIDVIDIDEFVNVLKGR